MFCVGIIGFLAGVLFKKGMLPKSKLPLCIYGGMATFFIRSEEHTSELQSHHDLVCRLLLEKKKNKTQQKTIERYYFFIRKHSMRLKHTKK